MTETTSNETLNEKSNQNITQTSAYNSAQVNGGTNNSITQNRANIFSTAPKMNTALLNNTAGGRVFQNSQNSETTIDGGKNNNVSQTGDIKKVYLFSTKEAKITQSGLGAFAEINDSSNIKLRQEGNKANDAGDDQDKTVVIRRSKDIHADQTGGYHRAKTAKARIENSENIILAGNNEAQILNSKNVSAEQGINADFLSFKGVDNSKNPKATFEQHQGDDTAVIEINNKGLNVNQGFGNNRLQIRNFSGNDGVNATAKSLSGETSVANIKAEHLQYLTAKRNGDKITLTYTDPSTKETSDISLTGYGFINVDNGHSINTASIAASQVTELQRLIPR